MLKGKNIIITGCNRGIGRSILETSCSCGANVWAHARALTPEFESLCKQLADKYQVSVTPLCFELVDFDAMKAAIKSIMQSKQQIHALVNNAGVTYNALFQMSQLTEVRNQFEVNFFAPYILTQYVTKLMVRKGEGAVVNIASSAALDGNAGKSAYGASKAALIAMTQSIAEELGEKGIRANCIAPGVTETEMLATMPDYVVDDIKKSNDLRRVGDPEDIAKTAVFLASDQSSYITGQVIRVDGGM